ncbi:hypothetical protein V7S43_013787 [Phytophthora oleae]
MPMAEGTVNYKLVEKELLLSVVTDYLPQGKHEWDQVAAVYNQRRERRAAPRSGASLKRKFASLYSVLQRSASTPSSLEKRVMELCLKITKKPSARSRTVCIDADRADACPQATESMPSVADPRLHEDTSDADEGSHAHGNGPIHQDRAVVTTALPLHAHCDAIRLFLWFQDREQNQVAQWRADRERAQSERKERELQREKDVSDAKKCHN